MPLPELTPSECERYEWQMACPGAGESGQRKLKAASVLISRCGGVGGAIAQQLAMAGVGRLVIAHAGPLRLSDLNRQALMRTSGIGSPRSGLIRERLRELNPEISVETIDANAGGANAAALVSGCDIVACAAPLFEERFALNAACVSQGKPFVHAAMFDFEFQVGIFHPPHTGCLRCLCPEIPSWWRRQFPVFGAVAGMTGALAAAEIIKFITGAGTPLTGRMLTGDLRGSFMHSFALPRDPQCAGCGVSAAIAAPEQTAPG